MMDFANVFIDPELIPPLCNLLLDEDSKEEGTCCGYEPEVRRLGAMAPPSPRVVPIDTKAPMPFLRFGPAEAFGKLKQACIDGSGVDFLAVCGDVMRTKNFASDKPGVAQRSFHKTGSAFDYNQASTSLIIVSDPHDGRQYFRTYLKCVKQDGTQGVKVPLKDIRGYKTNVYCWDFTAAAEQLGWKRIPAWAGWEHSYTKKELWHYEITEGKSYEYWIDFLYNSPVPTNPSFRVLRAGDTGKEVKDLQNKLIVLGYLKGQADGKFGVLTLAAVKKLQTHYGLKADGVVGKDTWAVL